MSSSTSCIEESENADENHDSSSTAYNSVKRQYRQNSSQYWERSMLEVGKTKFQDDVEKYDFLHRLSNSSTNEIIKVVLDKNSKFFFYFQEPEVEKDISVYLFIILGKACTDRCVSKVQNVVKNLNSNEKNILLHLQQYFLLLMKSDLNDLKQIHLDSLNFILKLMEKYQEIMPSSASEFVSMIVPTFDSALKTFLKSCDNGSVLAEIKKMLYKITEQNQFFRDNHSFFELKDLSKNEKLHVTEPPKSFRLIPVLPTNDDLRLPCSFLRPNIVRGPYRDVNHYLDVQFRLLREDYIMPLRDGIAEYLNLKKNKESFRYCQNVRVYSNVEIIDETIMHGDLYHVLNFKSKGFSEIQWDKSKRLLTGSLLCLSFDDFKSMHFATIKIRDPKELKKGRLTVQFEGSIEETFNLPYSTSFVTLESSAYFEAYKHNLIALLYLSSEMIPLKRYFIDVEKTVFHPVYLSGGIEYDFGSLSGLKIVPDKSAVEQSHTFERLGMTKVLDYCTWPSADNLCMDDSQLAAIKRAITKELAIIQGPPGTGKTFVGLKIVELLLKNVSSWFDRNQNGLPILVVCVTNHALDQFLEGILDFDFECQVVRFGGRSLNERILEQCSMDNSLIPKKLWDSFRAKKDEIARIQEKIKQEQSKIQNSRKVIFDEEILQYYMMPNHYKTLKKGFTSENKDILTIWDWLGLTSKEFSFDASKVNDLEKKSDANIVTFDSDLKNEEEDDDAIILENERNLDFYDPHASNNKNDESSGSKHSQESENYLKQEGATNSIECNFQQYLISTLNSVEVITEEVVASIKHVWKLNHEERWKLYKYWVNEYVKQNYMEIKSLREELETKFLQLEEERLRMDLSALRCTSVVGMTTNGAAKKRHLVQALNPAILIVEEAAEVLESHIITSLAPDTKHLILIGDQQQLRPKTTMHVLSAKYKMNISLFERMILNRVEYCKLSVQHRMRPEIASLIVPHIYPHLENHETVTEFEDILGMKKNVFFISHNFHESSVNDTKSKANKHEAKFLIGLCNYLILQGYESSRITILTTYTGQLFLLREIAKESIKDVRITVVDNFQGEENDIILISFVRSNDEGKIGFLKEPNRVCVALSRARKGLFCIGNFESFAEKNTLWENIRKTLVSSQAYGSFLPLICQNHPDTCTEIRSCEDFKMVPDGGCSKKCEGLFPCGHACPFMCHPFNHEKIKCEKPCMKTCERNHACEKKCYQECFCTVEIERTLKCGHTVKELCGKPEDKICCYNPCDILCKMGHRCEQKCFEKCYCKVQVEITLTGCGHTFKVLCAESENKIKCELPCKKKCSNLHPCELKCFESCYCKVLMNRVLNKCGHIVEEECGKEEWEIKCPLNCPKTLECSHPCLKKCGETCTTICKKQCIKSCSKGHPCQLKCYQQCECQIVIEMICPQNHKYQVKCCESKITHCPTIVEKTLSKCGHRVKMACGQKETLFQCLEKCEKVLKCSHKCMKKCSDNCETLCKQPCLRSCKKGHKCSKLCSEPCEPCEVLTNKTLSRCGHSVMALCGIPEELAECSSKCEKKLKCGHSCMNACGKPCLVYCKHLVEAKSPICGHSIQIKCSLFEEPELLSKEFHNLSRKCSKPCNDILLCGHECTGTCGSCYQQRIHVPCIAPCTKTLICGHKCMSTCSASCPPCKQPCENKCCHQTCPRACHEPCVKCTRKCQWSCPHDKCTRLCFEVCNRDPCNEPCPKFLPCSHPCIGFCGEPCPLLCSICSFKSEKDVQSRFYENDRYVVLEDCGHVFEVLGMDQWMNAIRKGSFKFMMKTCPQCGKVIRKNLRYSSIIKNALLLMEKIKMLMENNPDVNRKIQSRLWTKSKSLSSKWYKVKNEINKCLRLNFIRNKLELTNVENFLSILSKFTEIQMQNDVSLPNTKQTLSLIEDLKLNSLCLLSFITENFLNASEQQQIQLSYEVNRLKLVEKLMNVHKHAADCYDEFSDCVKHLNYKPFDNKMNNSCTSTLKIILSKLNESTNDLDCSMTLPYLKALNMSIGHWYVCPSKHVYCFIGYDGTCGKECYVCMDIENSGASKTKKNAQKKESFIKFKRDQLHRNISEVSSEKDIGDSDGSHWLSKTSQKFHGDSLVRGSGARPKKFSQSRSSNESFLKFRRDQLNRNLTEVSSQKDIEDSDSSHMLNKTSQKFHGDNSVRGRGARPKKFSQSRSSNESFLKFRRDQLKRNLTEVSSQKDIEDSDSSHMLNKTSQKFHGDNSVRGRGARPKKFSQSRSSNESYLKFRGDQLNRNLTEVSSQKDIEDSDGSHWLNKTSHGDNSVRGRGARPKKFSQSRSSNESLKFRRYQLDRNVSEVSSQKAIEDSDDSRWLNRRSQKFHVNDSICHGARTKNSSQSRSAYNSRFGTMETDYPASSAFFNGKDSLAQTKNISSRISKTPTSCSERGTYPRYSSSTKVSQAYGNRGQGASGSQGANQ